MENNLIIFGSNGFISRNFLKTYAKKYDSVYCIDVVEAMDKIADNIIYFNKTNIDNDSIFKHIKSSVINTAINFAWKGTSGPLRDNWDCQYGNVVNNLNNLELCKKIGVKKFFNFGSIMENELFMDVQNETINQNKLYALGKYNDHVLSSIFCKNNNISYINLIITNTFGVGENSPRLVNTIIDNYLNNKTMNFSKCNQLYSFVYIDDLVNILYLLLDTAIDNRRYVIGDTTPKSLEHYISSIYDLLNKHCNSNLKPVFSNDVQPSLSEKDLNTSNTFLDTKYKLENTFEEGIIKTYEWKKSSK